MGAYAWAELKTLWEHERLSMEQVIGQLLAHGEQSHNHWQTSQRQQEALERALAALTARVAVLETQLSKRAS
jgi:hypothetical protein